MCNQIVFDKCKPLLRSDPARYNTMSSGVEFKDQPITSSFARSGIIPVYEDVEQVPLPILKNHFYQ